MLLILKESVRGLGSVGQTTKVKPGYGRFLLNQNKALRATKENIAALEAQLSAIQEENVKKLQAAMAIKEGLVGKRFVVIRQAADDGRLFGSVTSRDVAQLLQNDGFDIHYRNVFFNGTIKSLGKYSVNVELHADVLTTVTLYVVRSESEVAKFDAKPTTEEVPVYPYGYSAEPEIAAEEKSTDDFDSGTEPDDENLSLSSEEKSVENNSSSANE